MQGDERQSPAQETQARDGRIELVIQAEPQAVATVTDGVTRLLVAHGWPDARIAEVQLALQEALTNAIRHGCRNDPSRAVRCMVTCDEDGDLVLVVRDPGDGFEVAAVADPLAPENVLKPGGRGVFLINYLMDKVDFRDGGREIEMRKRRQPLASLPPADS